MSQLHIPLLAQANAAMDDTTAGQVLSGMMVLLVMAASLAMIFVWIVRLGQTGHALPAARRGVLRVPFPLTMVAIGLSLLMLLLLISIPTTPEMTPSQMKSALIQTVVMDLMLFLVFGAVVFLSNTAGRVHLPDDNPDSNARGTVTTAGDNGWNSSPFPPNSRWPDLEDASVIPQLPGYAVLGERTAPSPSPMPFGSGNSFYAASRDALFTQPADAGSELNREPEEQLSFLTELRYAAEVFLAAYVPTTFLRILVVLLTVGLLGEEPGQHPFLEMMNSGVDVTVIGLILMTAVLFAPVVEELQFRIVVLGGIAQLGRPMLALSVSSILFAFAHGFPDSLALLPLAFALGYAYLRRRSYITVMLVHFLFNGFNMALALLALL